MHTMMQNYGNTFTHTTISGYLHYWHKGAICQQAPSKVHTWLQRDWPKAACVLA